MTILWLKAFHVIFMVAWFAGIFYLPRLFVYHAKAFHLGESVITEQFKIMERRLYYFVTPFALLTLVFGLALIYQYGMEWFRLADWLHTKLAIVILLYCYHGYCFVLLKNFKQGRNIRSEKFYRIINEAPVLALFAVVILAYVKP